MQQAEACNFPCTLNLNLHLLSIVDIFSLPDVASSVPFDWVFQYNYNNRNVKTIQRRKKGTCLRSWFNLVQPSILDDRDKRSSLRTNADQKDTSIFMCVHWMRMGFGVVKSLWTCRWVKPLFDSRESNAVNYKAKRANEISNLDPSLLRMCRRVQCQNSRSFGQTQLWLAWSLSE